MRTSLICAACSAHRRWSASDALGAPDDRRAAISTFSRYPGNVVTFAAEMPGRPKVSRPLENPELRSSTMSRLARPLEAIDLAATREENGHARQTSGSSAGEGLGVYGRRPPLPPSHSAPQLSITDPDGYASAPSRSRTKRSKEPKASKRGLTLRHGPVGPDTALDLAPRLPDARELLASNPRISASSMLGHVDLRIKVAQQESEHLHASRAAPRPRATPEPWIEVVTPSMARSASLPDVSHAKQTEAAALKHEVQQLLRLSPSASPAPPKRKRSAFARLFGVGGRKSEDSEREPRTSEESSTQGSVLRKGRPRGGSDRDRGGFAPFDAYVQPSWVPPTAYPLPHRQHASAEAEDALEVVAERAQMPEALRDFQWLAKTRCVVS